MTDGSPEDLADLREEIEGLREHNAQLAREKAQLAGTVSDLENDLAETQTLVEDLYERLAGLEANIDQMVGVAEDAQSTPEKRALDLRQILVELAEQDQEKGGNGQVARDYNAVIDLLESHGHGTVHPPQATQAMRDLHEIEGFAFVEKEDGNNVVRCKLSAVPSEAGFNEIKKDIAVAARADGGSTEDSTTRE